MNSAQFSHGKVEDDVIISQQRLRYSSKTYDKRSVIYIAISGNETQGLVHSRHRHLLILHEHLHRCTQSQTPSTTFKIYNGKQ